MRTARATRRTVRTRVAGSRETLRDEDVTQDIPAPRRHRRARVVNRDTEDDAPSGMGPTALNSRGHRLLLQGRYAEAERYLRQAVAQNPGYAYAQYNLGWCLLAQGKADEAIGPLQHSAAQQPDRPEPQEKLAEAYRMLDDEDRADTAARRARSLRRRHGGSGKAAPMAPKPLPTAQPVRSAVDSGSWLGSTDRREQRVITEWRALEVARRTGKTAVED